MSHVLGALGASSTCYLWKIAPESRLLYATKTPEATQQTGGGQEHPEST